MGSRPIMDKPRSPYTRLGRFTTTENTINASWETPISAGFPNQHQEGGIDDIEIAILISWNITRILLVKFNPNSKSYFSFHNQA